MNVATIDIIAAPMKLDEIRCLMLVFVKYQSQVAFLFDPKTTLQWWPISVEVHVFKFAEYERFFCCIQCRAAYKENYRGRIESLTRRYEE